MARAQSSQGVRDATEAPQASGARPVSAARKAGLAGLVQRALESRPVRVFLHYSSDNGPLIASGMTYQAFFALAAALWLVFSLLGFVLKANPDLQQRLFSAINGFLPHLVGTPGYSGVIQGSDLLDVAGLSVGTAVSSIGVLFTAVGFLATLRTAIRIMFALPGETTNPVLLKLKDLGLTIAFGLVVLLTSVVSLVANLALGLVLRALGLPEHSVPAQAIATTVSIAVIAAIDTAVVAAILRILSGIPIPVRRLWAGSLIAGVGLSVFEAAATSLLHLGTNNPALKTFATLIGVLVYFNLVCQIVLIGASWVAVGMADAGVDARTMSAAERDVDRAERIEAARQLVADANRQALEQRVRAARGLERWRLGRQLQRAVRAEARRRQRVPTTTEYETAQHEAGDTTPDADQVAAAAERTGPTRR